VFVFVLDVEKLLEEEEELPVTFGLELFQATVQQIDHSL